MAFETWTALASVALPPTPGPTMRPAARRGLNRAGGAMPMGAGHATAAVRRA